MISVSDEYKEIMNRAIRNRAYISIEIGLINAEAQEKSEAEGAFAYWSSGNIFDESSKIEYATLEENYMKTDGSMFFMPEETEKSILKNNGITTNEILGSIKIVFEKVVALKGLTIDFASSYPTKFTVKSANYEYEYDNTSEIFETNDVFGDSDYLLITPKEMLGGRQRFRIRKIIFGVGIKYNNQKTKTFEITENCSLIAEELSSKNVNFTFFDTDGFYDVNDENSYFDFLETMQKIKIKFGLLLDDKNIEWIQYATCFLEDWKSQKGIVSFKATDRLFQLEDEYSLGNKIYERTAYDEAVKIFEDAGLEEEEYVLEQNLKTITLKNPMPKSNHKECIQLLANACNCVIKHDINGKILIESSILNNLDYQEAKEYKLLQHNMLEQPIGYKEKRVKAVRVKIFSFQNNDNGEPEEVEDDVFFEKKISDVGEIKTLKNQLIHTEEMAENVANCLAKYYENVISYSVSYRGEPRISASDFIELESSKDDIPVFVTESKLQFSGTFSGELELKKI